jgi:exo-beta-1,3-glucanase (GH17 family)
LEAGDDGFQPATIANAKAYNNYLINRVLSGKTGTPHRPDADMDIYIFALFNENLKGQGPDDVEQYFGLLCPDMTKVYEFDFRGRGASSIVH